MSKYPTASSYYLARQCQWPWTSGLAAQASSSGKTWAARLGSLAHKLLERHIVGEPQDKQTAAAAGVLYGATPRMVEVALGCYASGVRYLQANEVVRNSAEVAFKIAPGHPAILPIVDRNYPDESAFFGTADLVAQIDGGDVRKAGEKLVLVSDWKTGISSAKYIARAKWQLRVLTYAATKVHGVPGGKAEAVYLDKNGGAPFVSSEVLGPAELAGVGEDLAKTHSLLQQQPAPNPGPHCEHCPVRAKCPVAWEVFE